MTLEFGRKVVPSRRRPVSWYSPPVLMQAGRELVSSIDFLRNSDRRELFTGEFDPIEFYAERDGSFGFDFIADTGDGGNATHTVAEAALRPALQAEGAAAPLARPPLVVLGGDLAYPGASSLDYHYRFLEPFALARPPATLGDPQRAWREVLAIPQNHDWFDSTTTFCRYFVGRSHRPTEFVDAYARQQRTYFAAKLPHRWWILGLDFALKGDIDRNQFRDICALWGPQRTTGPRIEPGDNIILVYPEPYWTRKLSHGTPKGYTARYQRLEYLLEGGPNREDRESHGAQAHIRLRLSGDLHHYCRHYTTQGEFAEDTKHSTNLVTCGSGGAFLHTTHGSEVQDAKIIDRSLEQDTEPASLGLRIRVGLRDNTCSEEVGKVKSLEQTVCYPNVETSRCLARVHLPLSIIAGLNFSYPWPDKFKDKVKQFFKQLWDSNLGFAICLGLLYGFNGYANSIALSDSFVLDDFQPIYFYDLNRSLFYDWLRAMFFTPFATLVNVVMIVGCVRIAWEGTWGWYWKLLSGIAHGLLHAVAVCLVYYAAATLVYHWCPDVTAYIWRGLLTWTLVTVFGAVVGALIFGLYFAIFNGVFRQLTNNASGAMAIQDYKGFLRFRITADALEAHYLVCDRVARKWDIPKGCAPNGKQDESKGRIVVDGTPPQWRVEDRFTLRR